MSLTINKYKIETLYREHIVFVCVNVMLTFFTLYKDDMFLAQLKDVYEVTKTILLNDISIFGDIVLRTLNNSHCSNLIPNWRNNCWKSCNFASQFFIRQTKMI